MVARSIHGTTSVNAAKIPRVAPPRGGRLDGSNAPPPPRLSSNPTNLTTCTQAAADNLVGAMEPDNGFGLGRAPDHARPVTVDSTRDRPLSRQQQGGGRGGGGGNAAFMAGAPAAGQVIHRSSTQAPG